MVEITEWMWNTHVGNDRIIFQNSGYIAGPLGMDVVPPLKSPHHTVSQKQFIIFEVNICFKI